MFKMKKRVLFLTALLICLLMSMAGSFFVFAFDTQNSLNPVAAQNVFIIPTDNNAGNKNSDGTDFLTFSGKKTDSRTYKLYDEINPESALFQTSPSNRLHFSVPVSAYDYDNIVADTYADNSPVPSNWRQSENAMRAFTLTYSSDTIKIIINRRVDNIAGKEHLPFEIPLIISVSDDYGNQCSTIITLLIANTTPQFKPYSQAASGNNSAYELTYSQEQGYELNLTLTKNQKNARIYLKDILSDIDFDNYQTDNFRFIKGNDYPLNLYVTKEDYIVKQYEYGSTNELFKIITDPNYSYFEISALSSDRGVIGIAYLKIADKIHSDIYPSCTDDLKIILTIGNSAAVIKSDANLEIYQYGADSDKTGSDYFSPKHFLITDFVIDPNQNDNNLYSGTYLRIKSVEFQKPSEIYCTLKSQISENENLFNAGIVDTDDKRQSFYISLRPGYYGTQNIKITVIDDGRSGTLDAVEFSFNLTFNVIYNPDMLNENNLNIIKTFYGKALTLTNDLIFKTINGFNYGTKYSVTKLALFEENYINIQSNNEQDGFIIKAVDITNNNDYAFLQMNFVVENDNSQKEYSHLIKLIINPNTPPQFLDYFNDAITFSVSPNISNFVLGNNHSLTISLSELLADPEHDNLVLLSAKSQKPSIVKAEKTDNGSLMIKFNARGESLITLNVLDESGNSYTMSFLASNFDLKEPGFWRKLSAFIESNTVVFYIIISLIVLFILFLIALFWIIRNKRIMRREIEEILIAEMELEDRMLKLAVTSVNYQPLKSQSPKLLLNSGMLENAENNLADFDITTEELDEYLENINFDDFDDESF